MGPAAFGEGVGGDDSDSDVPPLEQLLAELDAEADEEDAALEAEGGASPSKEEEEEPGFEKKAPSPGQLPPFVNVRPVTAQDRPLHFEPRPPTEELEIPTSKLKDIGTINEVRRKVGRLQTLSNKGLERECRQTGLPYDANFERRAFLEAVRDLVVWQHLPLSELDRECKAKGLRIQASAAPFRGKGPDVGFSTIRRQKECLQALAEDLREKLCRRIWESQGIPVSRVDDLQACEYLAERYSVIEAMGMQELLQWYRGLGLPSEQSISAEALRSLAKNVELWHCMSWASLRGECECKKASVEPPETEGGEACEEEGEEHREALVNRLLTKAILDRWEECGLPAHTLGLDACLHVVQKSEEWRVMGSAELRKLYAEMNLPEERGVEKQELVKTLRTMLIWGLLPVAELQDECREQGLPAEKSFWDTDHVPEEEEEDQELRSQLIQRLMVRRLTSVYERKGIPAKELDAGTVVYLYEEFGKLDAMAHPELAKVCEESGLPVAPEATPQDLRKLMRHLHIWSTLPESALREECRVRDISGRAVAKTHEELLGLLLGDVCRGSFDALGIPVDRLGSFANCQQVMLEWSAISAMRVAEKVKGYRDMGFSSAPSDPELTDRLRKVHVWLNLPFKELQKDCRKYDVNSIAKEEDRTELVGLIIAKLWGERLPMPGAQQPPPPPPPPPSNRWGSAQHRSQAPRAPHWGGSKGGSKGGCGPAGYGGRGDTGKGSSGGPHERQQWAPHRGPPPGNFGHPTWGGNPFSGPHGRFVPPDFSRGQAHGFASAGRGEREEVPENICRHFRLLELPVTAGHEEVRKAYRKLALKCHPDKQQPGSSASSASAEEFHKLTHAQEELTAWLRRNGR